jgi:amino acid adenylation domain-containing protein
MKTTSKQSYIKADIQLKLLADAKTSHQLKKFNQNQTFDTRNLCIHQIFEEQVKRSPDAVAVAFENTQFTYRQLNQRANQLAHHLQTLGVGSEVLVGICLERSLEMIVGLLGILKAGGAYVPLDPAYPVDRLAFIFDDTQTPVVLTQKHLVNKLPNGGAQVLCLDSDWELIAQNSPENPVCETNSENLIYAIYTSGSTGKPKGVMIPHGGINNLLHDWQNNFKLTSTDKVLQTISFSFDPSVLQIFWPLCFGGQLIMARPGGHQDTAYLVKTIIEQRITILNLVPSIVRVLLEEKGIEECKFLRQITTGGEALSKELMERFFARMNMDNVLVNCYGPTEASVGCTFWVCQRETDYSIAPIGRAIANTQIYILDEDLQPVPVGEPGELHIAGIGLARGYLNRPDLTQEKFIPNPFVSELGERLYKTGDLARYLPDGNLEFLGRIDHQVKIRGFRIELGEVEAVLSQYPGLEEILVMAREDIPGDQRLVAYIKVANSEQVPNPRELRRFLQDKLPDYMVPAAFVFLDTLPFNPNGKLDRRALPAPDASSFGQSTDFVAPRTSIEKVLAEIWTQVLGLEQVSINDNFFELGGHSLLATQVISRCRQAFNVEIPLHLLFEKPAIATFAEAITSNNTQNPSQNIARLTNRESIPLSFAQQRIWLVEQIEPNNTAYLVPMAQRLLGKLNVDVLQQSLDAIAVHHETIRTNFITTSDGNPLQIITEPRPVELKVIDLNQIQNNNQDEQVQRLLNQEMQRPFDLASDLMLRATLLKINDQEHILLLVMHHIASDGWSMGILWEQLVALYTAFLTSKPNPLPKLSIQYADYAVWQRKCLSQEVLEKQLNYWKQQLAGANPILELPSDRSRPSVQTYRGASLSVTLPQSLSASLKQLCRQEGVTLYMTLLAAFQTLLYRYSQQEDILVGSAIAGRNHAEIEGLIGFFVNTLVLRTDLSGHPSFQELLRRVRSVTLEAYTNQNLPFEKLVEELQPERSLSYNPLFQVMFILQNAPGQASQLPGLTETPVELKTETAKFDLTLSVEEKDGILIGSWNYNTDLFDSATITRMAGHFQTLLSDIVTDSGKCISFLSLLTDSEKEEFIGNFNDNLEEN